MEVLGRFYETDRIQAYKHIGAKVEFDLGDYHTPMSIAYDAGAQEFLGHSCCQTLLKLIWMNTMDINTPWYKLLPILTVFTFLWITFKQAVLQYSSMKSKCAIHQLLNIYVRLYFCERIALISGHLEWKGTLNYHLSNSCQFYFIIY